MAIMDLCRYLNLSTPMASHVPGFFCSRNTSAKSTPPASSFARKCSKIRMICTLNLQQFLDRKFWKQNSVRKKRFQSKLIIESCICATSFFLKEKRSRELFCTVVLLNIRTFHVQDKGRQQVQEKNTKSANIISLCRRNPTLPWGHQTELL